MSDRPAPAEAPQTLYHYTSQEGLLGIIQEKVLWTSSIRHVNDAAELSYAISIMKSRLGVNHRPELNPEDNLWTKFRRGVSKHLDVFEKSDSHVGSFSQERDQLSQWRAYTGRGTGFSIGFNSGMLEGFATSQRYELLRCTYEAKEHEELADRVIEKAEVILRKKGAENVDGAVACCVADFMRVAPRLKHPSFSEEKEWRLFRMVEIEEPVKFRVGKSMLVPYAEFMFQDESENTPIEVIVVGPTPHMSLSVASVQRLLLAHDMAHVAVIESSVPFRNW